MNELQGAVQVQSKATKKRTGRQQEAEGQLLLLKVSRVVYLNI